MKDSDMGTGRLKKYTVRLWEDDVERIRLYYPNLGHNLIARVLLHRHRIALDNHVAERLSQRELDKGGSE